MYQIKSIESSITDLDEKNGVIKGYFSKFGNVDADNDAIAPGSFTKTLKENYTRLKHLLQHDTFKPLSATKDNKLILKEDKYGLEFISTISKTSWGIDTLQLYADGVIDEHSIGFQPIKTQAGKNHRLITEIKLWEGSTVTWGANALAKTKSLFTPDKITQKMNAVIKSIRSGKFQDEDTFDQLEMYLVQLQQVFQDLKTTQPVVETVEPDENEYLLNEIKLINKLFN